MADKRMISKKVIHSDDFMDLPATTKNLYFYLMIEADDDGFVNSPKRIQRMTGATDDDAKLLLAKKFIISFESGIIVIKHWRMHNYIRSDRYKETTHLKEKEKLHLKDNGIYTLDTVGIPSGSIDKNRLDKVSSEESKEDNNKIGFENFIDNMLKSFEEKKLLTFKSKINKTVDTRKAFSRIGDEHHVIRSFTEYVARNRNMAARLDKFIMAHVENNVNDLEYCDKNKKSSKEPEYGSIAWRMEQEKTRIDTEVIDVSY